METTIPLTDLPRRLKAEFGQSVSYRQAYNATVDGRIPAEAGAKRYGKTLRQVRVDGEQTQLEADIHPDPLVESVRNQICEAELIQAIGRARAIRRTAAHLATSTVIPASFSCVCLFNANLPSANPGGYGLYLSGGRFLGLLLIGAIVDGSLNL